MRDWPPIADLLIRTGWAYAVPVRSIMSAVELATGWTDLTRNMIIGRAHRLKLPPHPLASNKTPHRGPQRPPPAAASARAA
jgi:hypothetical protein